MGTRKNVFRPISLVEGMEEQRYKKKFQENKTFELILRSKQNISRSKKRKCSRQRECRHRSVKYEKL